MCLRSADAGKEEDHGRVRSDVLDEFVERAVVGGQRKAEQCERHAYIASHEVKREAGGPDKHL